MDNSCIIIVGKPGAGKSSIGVLLAKLLGGTYMSLGGFMRETLGIPDPHIGVDKNDVYSLLDAHLRGGTIPGVFVLDCHPYPEKDLEALQAFVNESGLQLRAVIYVLADDDVALKRLQRRPRSGQSNEDRLKYFEDHVHLIERFAGEFYTIRIENNVDFETIQPIERIARDVVSQLSM